MISQKGIVLSLITMLMLSPLILLSLTYSQSLRGYGRQMGSLTRAQEGFYFLESVHSDLERAGEIIGKRAIIGATSTVTNTGKGVDNASQRLGELFVYGTINGNQSAQMINSTIDNWLNGIKAAASRKSFNVSFSTTGISVDIYDSFTVRYNVSYSIAITDQRGTFTLRANITKTSYVSIEGLEDPLFPLTTAGKGFSIFERTNYTNFTKIAAQGNGGNSWGSGKVVVMNSDDIITYPNKSSMILVTNSINSSTNSTASLFAGVITQQLSAALSNPYIVNATAMAFLPNNTQIALDGSGGKAWDITNLHDAWEGQKYSITNGPSIFDRLEGKFTNSYAGKGLETTLRKDSLSASGVPITQSKTSVDYIYLGNQTLDGQRVRGMPDEFRIDTQNQGFYNVQSLVY